MKFVFTFDYELFFGSQTGTVQKCMIEPTERLIEIFDTYNVKVTFFPDIHFICRLSEEASRFPKLESELTLVINQLRRIQEKGHDIQYHLHPHWEDSYYTGQKWVCDTTRYSAASFTEAELESIVYKNVTFLNKKLAIHPKIVRSGGLSMQGFPKLISILSKYGIRCDSSVFHGGYAHTASHQYDFRNIPTTSYYFFSSHPEIVEKNGQYIEYPIHAHWYSPFYYINFLFQNYFYKSDHQIIGDGNALPIKGLIKKGLLKGNMLPFSSDGFFSSQLENISLQANKELVICLGHPKNMSLFAFRKLESFLMKYNKKIAFTALSTCIE